MAACSLIFSFASILSVILIFCLETPRCPEAPLPMLEEGDDQRGGWNKNLSGIASSQSIFTDHLSSKLQSMDPIGWPVEDTTWTIPLSLFIVQSKPASPTTGSAERRYLPVSP